MQASSVEWQTYAQTYDMLLSYNPFYQDLRTQVLHHFQQLSIASGGTVADLGAGTGNYSVAIAKAYRDLSVIHIDRDAGMIKRAREKKQNDALHNLSIIQQSIEETDFASNSLSAITAIHSLYTFPSPNDVIRRCYDWLEPGGYAIFVDPGRTVKILDWQWAIGKHLIKTYGLSKTFQIMKEGKEVSRQNRKISRMQAKGEFWLHSHQEFCDTLKKVGFEIIQAETTFRGISDLAVVRKGS